MKDESGETIPKRRVPARNEWMTVHFERRRNHGAAGRRGTRTTARPGPWPEEPGAAEEAGTPAEREGERKVSTEGMSSTGGNHQEIARDMLASNGGFEGEKKRGKRAL